MNGPLDKLPSDAEAANDTNNGPDAHQNFNAVNGILGDPSTSNAPGTQEPYTAADGSSTIADDMSLIDPQLHPTSPTGLPIPLVNAPFFGLPASHTSAPQAASGSAASAFAAPLPPPTALAPSPFAITASSSVPVIPPALVQPPSPALPMSPALPTLSTAPSSAPVIPPALVQPPSPALTVSPALPTLPAPLAPPAPSSVMTTSFPPVSVQPQTINGAALTRKAPTKSKAKKRPGVQPTSALQKVAEKATREKAVAAEKVTAEKENAWSKDLAKAVKAAEARTAKAAVAKAARAAKAVEANAAKVAAAAAAAAAAEVEAAAAVAASTQTVLQPGRSQRIRKAATSKEVVPLTEKRKRTDTKENDG